MSTRNLAGHVNCVDYNLQTSRQPVLLVCRPGNACACRPAGTANRGGQCSSV